MNDIFDFVGVHQVNDDSVFDYQLNSGNEKYKTSGISHALNRNKFSRTLKGMLPAAVVEKLKTNVLVQGLLRKKMEKETLPEDVLPVIMEILTEDANKLRELTGKSFSEWSV